MIDLDEIDRKVDELLENTSPEEMREWILAYRKARGVKKHCNHMYKDWGHGQVDCCVHCGDWKWGE